MGEKKNPLGRPRQKNELWWKKESNDLQKELQSPLQLEVDAADKQTPDGNASWIIPPTPALRLCTGIKLFGHVWKVKATFWKLSGLAGKRRPSAASSPPATFSRWRRLSPTPALITLAAVWLAATSCWRFSSRHGAFKGSYTVGAVSHCFCLTKWKVCRGICLNFMYGDNYKWDSQLCYDKQQIQLPCSAPLYWTLKSLTDTQHHLTENNESQCKYRAAALWTVSLSDTEHDLMHEEVERWCKRSNLSKIKMSDDQLCFKT